MKITPSHPFLLAVFGGFSFLLASSCAAPVTVEITEKPLVKDCIPFGINVNSQAYFSGPQLKMAVEENFEGSLYRQVHSGPMYDANGFHSTINTVVNKNTGKPVPWYGLLKGADFTILSGPARGTCGKIKEIELRDFEEAPGKVKQGSWFIFDKPLKMPADQPTFSVKNDMGAGMIVENLERVKDGTMGVGNSFNPQGNCTIYPESRTGGFGYASACIDPKIPEAKPEEEADADEGDKKKDTKDMKGGTMVFTMPFQHFMDNNGSWHFNCWMKAKEPGAKAKIGDKKFTGVQEIALTPEWKKYELVFKADKVEEMKVPSDKKRHQVRC